MKTKPATRRASASDCGIYLSIVAKDHDEMRRKVAKLHRAFNGRAQKARGAMGKAA